MPNRPKSLFEIVRSMTAEDWERAFDRAIAEERIDCEVILDDTVATLPNGFLILFIVDEEEGYQFLN